jgi:hypothetical protein
LPAGGVIAAATIALLAAAGVATMLVVAAVVGIQTGAWGQGGPGPVIPPSDFAIADIPAEYLRLYQQAAARFGIDWPILAGIGRVECDHGRDPAPSCRRFGAVNAAGAGGPMQFLAATWTLYGVDGDGDGKRDRWDPADAIFGAANYLRASGAPGNYAAAILAYNHANWYLAEVESWADRYAPGWRGSRQAGRSGEASGGGVSATPIRLIAGSVARLDPADGHLALIPAQAPPVVKAMLIAGDELQDLPYGPQGHPNPLGSPAEDCSSSVNYVLYRSGLRPLSEIIARNPLAQDYVGWGVPGPGRWVSIYATDTPTPHVFIVIAGLRLDTAHAGSDVGPNRREDGPRWRIFPTLPAWAHWSVRHPPGL